MIVGECNVAAVGIDYKSVVERLLESDTGHARYAWGASHLLGSRDPTEEGL